MSRYQSPPDPNGFLSLPKTEEDFSDQNLVNLTYSNRAIAIEEYLRSQPETDIIQIRSANQYSLLHIATINNQLTICRILLRHLTNKNIHFKEIKKWVNMRTPNGHTAIHFASLNGNLDLISLLQEHEADIYLKDNDGLDVMHFAAQGDQCISLVYFNGKGLSIHAKDNKGRTPLHIAAMEGTENAINYLTSRDSLINTQCSELGYTPLHYAIVTGNFKIVKRLLIKKADPSIRSKKGESASELAQKSNNFAIMKILRRKTWLNRILGLQQGLPQGRSWHTFILFFVLYLGITAVQLLFVFPFVEYQVWIILFGIFDSILLFLFLICWLKGPGALRNTGRDSMLLLLQKSDPQEICFDCAIRKPMRSKHCENCETCVSVFDHHCTWTNNCVGAKNHGLFLCLVITALLSLILLLLIQIIHYQKKAPLYLYLPDYTHLDLRTMVLVKNILTLTCGVITIMLILPLTVLNYIQLGNFFTGKTTNERFGHQVRHKESQALTRESVDSEDYFEERDESQLSKALGNCWDMCFGNARNKRYGGQGAYYDDDILVLP